MSAYKKYIDELLPNREYHCEFDCGKVFKNRPSYELHVERMHNVNVEKISVAYYKCPAMNCSYFGGNVRLLRRHYQSAHLEKKFTCFKCQRKYIIESKFRKHKCDVQQHNCPICSKVFRYLGMRNRHVQKCAKRAQALGKIAEPNSDKDQLQNMAINLHLSDEIFIEEFQQLLRNIDNRKVDNPDLIRVLIMLTPRIQELHSEIN